MLEWLQGRGATDQGRISGKGQRGGKIYFRRTGHEIGAACQCSKEFEITRMHRTQMRCRSWWADAGIPGSSQSGMALAHNAKKRNLCFSRSETYQNLQWSVGVCSVKNSPGKSVMCFWFRTVYSFPQQIIVECSLCVGQCSGRWGYNIEQVSSPLCRKIDSEQFENIK